MLTVKTPKSGTIKFQKQTKAIKKMVTGQFSRREGSVRGAKVEKNLQFWSLTFPRGAKLNTSRTRKLSVQSPKKFFVKNRFG